MYGVFGEHDGKGNEVGQCCFPFLFYPLHLLTKSSQRVEDIEPEITSAADIIIDYGKMKYSYPRTSSSMYDFKHHRLLRYGACYNVMQDAFRRWYDIDLPDDPGKEALFSGNVLEEQNKY